MAGVCFACSVECHDGHELIELYTKRGFTCDCGNDKFQDKCKLMVCNYFIFYYCNSTLFELEIEN